MKLLQINKFYYPIIGGIETIVKDIAEHLPSDVLVCQEKGKRKIEEINNIKVYRASSWGKYLGLPLSFDFFKLAKKIIPQYDTILIHHPFPLAFVLLPFIKKKRIFILYHSDIIRQKISQIPFLPFIHYGLRKSEKIIVSGENIIKYSPILKRYRDKCIIVPFGLDLNKYQTTQEDKQKAEKLKKQYPSPLLLSVGRLVPYKGFQYLIPALKKLDAHLIIIGEGREKKGLEKLIKQHKLQNKITIINHVNRLTPYYLASDIFVFPSCSRNEAFGLVQLEAMYYEKPIINTVLHTAVEEVSVSNVTGLSADKKNTFALYSTIKYLLNNPQLKTKMGQKAHQVICEKHDLKTFISALKSILK